jgi:ankyrin repeat protein
LETLPQEDRLRVFVDAVKNSQLDVVQQLKVEQVVTVFSHENILMLAAQHSTPELLEWLLETESFINAATRFPKMFNNALGEALKVENLPNIKLLLSRGASILGNAYYSSHSHLLCALQHWNGDLMQFLVEDCGITLPTQWPDKMYHPASIFNAPHLAGASVEDVRRRFVEVKPYILWPEAFTLAPSWAACSGSPALIRISLENGGDPNKSTGGTSALQWVAGMRHGSRSIEMMKLLLEHGADPNVGRSPLYVAVLCSNPELVKLLLQHGANPKPDSGKPITRLAGMKKIEAYFGAPWEDIVRRLQQGEDLEGGQNRRRRAV